MAEGMSCGWMRGKLRPAQKKTKKKHFFFNNLIFMLAYDDSMNLNRKIETTYAVAVTAHGAGVTKTRCSSPYWRQYLAAAEAALAAASCFTASASFCWHCPDY